MVPCLSSVCVIDTAKLNIFPRLINQVNQLWTQMKGNTDSKLLYQTGFQFLYFSNWVN